MAFQAVRVQEKGQVTIPREIREKLKLKKGDLVTFVETSEGVLILPVEMVASQAMDRIGKVLRERGISLDEMVERSREARQDIIREEYGIDENSEK